MSKPYDSKLKNEHDPVSRDAIIKYAKRFGKSLKANDLSVVTDVDLILVGKDLLLEVGRKVSANGFTWNKLECLRCGFRHDTVKIENRKGRYHSHNGYVAIVNPEGTHAFFIHFSKLKDEYLKEEKENLYMKNERFYYVPLKEENIRLVDLRKDAWFEDIQSPDLYFGKIIVDRGIESLFELARADQ